jgi:transmembrane sensor
MPSTERIHYLFRRFFDKTYTAEEREELMEYLRQSEYDQHVKDLIEESWSKELPEYEQTPDRADAIFRYITQHEAAQPVGRIVTMKQWLRNAAGMAATVLLAITAWYLWPAADTPAGKTIAASHIEYQCNGGERETFVLPDGTTVKLNSNSSLIVPDNFSKETRSVSLKGEAFFDVAHDAARPFIITTHQMQIRVLGTSFNVKAYEEDNVFETAVIRGSVEVTLARNSQKVVLHPNEKISLNNSAVTAVRWEPAAAKQPGAPEKIATVQPVTRNRDSSIVEISWTEDKLAFAGERFPDMIKKIERWYNIKVLFANEEVAARLQEERLTATFHNEKLELVMEALQLANGKFHYRLDKEGNVVISD